MKNRIACLLCLWVLILYPCTGFTQSTHCPSLTVNVAFDFVVGNEIFPAGRYRFESLLNSVPGKDSIDVLVVRGITARLYKAVVTDVTVSSQGLHSKLVFRRVGNRMFLSEVWEAGKKSGCRLQLRPDDSEGHHATRTT